MCFKLFERLGFHQLFCYFNMLALPCALQLAVHLECNSSAKVLVSTTSATKLCNKTQADTGARQADTKVVRFPSLSELHFLAFFFEYPGLFCQDLSAGI